VKTNLADYPVTMAMKDGRVTQLVTLDCCGPALAHDAFKAMLRENAFEARRASPSSRIFRRRRTASRT
jgi:4,5-dihydroxyphthalate decarboxylase